MSPPTHRGEQPDLVAAILGIRSGSGGRSGLSSAGDDGDDRRMSAFLRGLTIGAIVGAAIAGSTIWSRWRRDRAASAPDRSLSGGEDGLG